MTVQELIDSGSFQIINVGEDTDRAITVPFCCDLLSIAMGRAPAGCAWVTVMGNMNTLAVATLADAACIIMAEGTALDGIAMKTLFTVGSLLPAVGVAILLKQVVNKATDFLTFFFGFTLAACMGVNLIGAAVIGGFFAVINYKIQLLKLRPVAAGPGAYDDDEEDI